MALYADIIIDISHEKLDRTFQYRVPESMAPFVSCGNIVNIPFGKGKRIIRGFVVGLSDEPKIDPKLIKDIASIEEKSISIEGQLISLAAWIKTNYGGTMNQALKTVLPVKKETAARVNRMVYLNVNQNTASQQLEKIVKRHAIAQERLLSAMMEQSPIPYETITGKLNIAPAVIKNLADKGILRIEETRAFRDPLSKLKKSGIAVELNETQEAIVEDILDRAAAGDLRPSLIHGVTGSGKTEVYIKLIEEVVADGRQAVMLIPEIALTFQTVMRFYNHFGDRVSIINSKMSAGERFDQFERAKEGLIDVIIGPRSALFTPFPDLGLIIIDEEHETSYKSETMPCYHARETAVERAGANGGFVVLGSATPSIESYDAAVNGRYKLYEMLERVKKRALPDVEIIDLREELRRGNRSILSERLIELMNDRLDKNEQIMLFINRRGVAGFVSCRMCGHVIKCPHCDVSLNLHNNNKLVCHYCGYQTDMVKTCPECGSKYIGGFKAGTQKIEEVVRNTFPKARVLRMDTDTTKNKGDYANILSTFANEQADILIGTQMIVKGHDFPKVTLVGVLAADLSLHVNDYHAAERTFQLLTQAAGRAGRGERSGEVIIQTYQPEHYGVTFAAKQDYKSFYEREISYRDIMHYPPKWNLMVVHISSLDEKLANDTADMLKYNLLTWTGCEGEEKKHVGTQIVGPADASVSKVRDVYRKLIYLKDSDYGRLLGLKDQIEEYISDKAELSEVTIQFDFNPMNGF